MLTTMLATAKRNYYIAKRVFPWSFIVQRIVIGLYTVLFSYFIYHYMFRGYLDSRFETYTGSSDYITYTILGVSLYTFAVSTLMNVGRSLMNELREGTLEALLLSPCSRKGYFLGNLIEQVGRSFLEFFVVLIVGWLLGAKLLNIKIEQLIIVLILSIFSFFSMGVSLATVMLRTRDTYITQNTLFIIVSLVCGISYPIQYLPTWLQVISHVLPLTHVLELFRKVVIFGDLLWHHWILIIKLVALSLMYLLFGFWWLSRVEKQLIEKTFG